LLRVDALGQANVPSIVRDSVPAGVDLFVQWVIADDQAIEGVALSNAVMARTP